MTTIRRDDDTAATPCVSVAAVVHVGGSGFTWWCGDVTPPRAIAIARARDRASERRRRRRARRGESLRYVTT